uniref:Putative complex I intermediate-associated protein 30, mitochondrial n=1 Tax=Lygus hesperus TaxID=30085 RepID=A0A0A9YAT8_LYGHE
MATSRCHLAIKVPYCLLRRTISTTPRTDLFWERDPKSGYGKKIKFNKDLVVDGFTALKSEMRMLKQELVAHWESDPVLITQPGFEHKVWDFKNPEDLDTWTLTSDSDHAEGYSKCTFSLSPGGHGLFSGVLSTDVPKDGVIKRAGYCSIRSHRARKSFKRDSYWNWSNYTHLVIRCRGDGRSYMMNIATSGYFDQLWNDVFHYPLYTRGGPYWQVTRVPFSKFFFSSKGRIQDIQHEVDLEKITNFGLTIADSINAPFRLEIDYIGLLCDPSEQETFAYESYKIPKGIAAT